MVGIELMVARSCNWTNGHFDLTISIPPRPDPKKEKSINQIIIFPSWLSVTIISSSTFLGPSAGRHFGGGPANSHPDTPNEWAIKRVLCKKFICRNEQMSKFMLANCTGCLRKVKHFITGFPRDTLPSSIICSTSSENTMKVYSTKLNVSPATLSQGPSSSSGLSLPA